jgi:hypothetical protein
MLNQRFKIEDIHVFNTLVILLAFSLHNQTHADLQCATKIAPVVVQHDRYGAVELFELNRSGSKVPTIGGDCLWSLMVVARRTSRSLTIVLHNPPYYTGDFQQPTWYEITLQVVFRFVESVFVSKQQNFFLVRRYFNE